MKLPTSLKYPLIAVGDLHGQLDLLDDLLSRLSQLKVWEQSTLVFLGDFCDRGGDTKGVIDRVLGLVQSGKATAVQGNHDLALVRAAGLDGQPFSPWWRKKYQAKYDSHVTFRSYLGHDLRPSRAAADFRALAAAMPTEHKDFLSSLPWLAEAEGHLFLHCGLSRGLLLNAQQQLASLRRRQWHAGMVHPDDVLLEGHDEYPAWLGADRDSSAFPLPCPGKVQVTGHVYVARPDVTRTRIRIDTTGGRLAPLTACVLTSKTAKPTFVQGRRAPGWNQRLADFLLS